MAQPAFREVGTTSHTDGTTNPAPGLPSGTTTGDILLVMVIVGNGAATVAVSGYTAIGSGVGGTNIRAYWFWKRAGASESAPSVSITSNSGYSSAVCAAYSGCVTSGTPYEDATTAGETTSTTPASATVTTTGVDRRCVCLFGVEDNTVWGTAPPPSGWTSRLDDPNGAGTDGRLCIQEYNSNPGSGSDVTATTMGTLSPGAEYWASLTLLLIPDLNQTITPDRAAATGAAYAPAIIPGGVTLTPSTATATGASYAPTIQASVTLTPGQAAATGASYDVTLTPGTATITPATAAATGAAYDPAIIPGAVTLGPGVAAATGAAYDATLTPGAATLAPDAATATGAAHNPSIIPGAVSVGLDAAAATAAANDVTVIPGAATLELQSAGASATAYDVGIVAGDAGINLAIGTATATASAYGVGISAEVSVVCGSAAAAGSAYGCTLILPPIVLPGGGGGGGWRRARPGEWPEQPRRKDDPRKSQTDRPRRGRIELKLDEPTGITLACGFARASARAYGVLAFDSTDWAAIRAAEAAALDAEIEADDEEAVLNLLITV